MSWEPGTNNTGTALAAMSPDSVRILWSRTADLFDQQNDFWAKFEGTSKDDSVHVIDDLSVGAGLTFRMTSIGAYYNRGKSGEALFLDQDDFAKEVINSNEFKADFLRNAASASDRTDEIMGMRGEISSGQAARLGAWMGREKSARAGMTFVLKSLSDNIIYGGGKTSEAALTSADGLSYDDLLLMGQSLKPKGGRPSEIGTINGNPVYKYIVVGTTPSLFSLKQDPDYKLILREAAPREKIDSNPLFTGGYTDIDGHRIVEHNPIDGDGYAWAGSWFNAKAYLGAAITAGTAAFAIKGGGSAAAAAETNIDFFRFFQNFAFEFLPTDIFVPGSDEKYVLIVNPRGAVTADNPQPGGVGMYAYTTGNIGTQITVTKRLAPAQNGPVALATVGSVTYNGGVWSTGAATPGPGHSATHPIGSTVVQCNARGQPIGYSLMMGAMALIRGYGMDRNKREQWRIDAFVTRKYIQTTFGQVLRKNVSGKYPGHVLFLSAISYPELGLPVVV